MKIKVWDSIGDRWHKQPLKVVYEKDGEILPVFPNDIVYFYEPKLEVNHVKSK